MSRISRPPLCATGHAATQGKRLVPGIPQGGYPLDSDFRWQRLACGWTIGFRGSPPPHRFYRPASPHSDDGLPIARYGYNLSQADMQLPNSASATSRGPRHFCRRLPGLVSSCPDTLAQTDLLHVGVVVPEETSAPNHVRDLGRYHRGPGRIVFLDQAEHIPREDM